MLMKRVPLTESHPLEPLAGRWPSIAAEELPTRASSTAATPSGPQVPRWKRVIDLGAILCLLPIVLPLSGLISLWIKCVSPGPPLFRQTRIGFRGQRFTCFKFRSMHVGADASAHQSHVQNLRKANQPMRKMDAEDDRLIPLGRLLRATGLDELPQLINVLRGEMSLVGPRPCLAYEFEHYRPWEKGRCNVLPGLTGLWQVSGKNETTFDEMIELDLSYVVSASPRMDVWIILRTFGTLFRQIQEWGAAARSS